MVSTNLETMTATLNFTAEGTFRIVQFNDTQDGHLTDRRTLQFMEAVLDQEQPQFVVINGDVIDGAPNNPTEVRQAINNVVQPMEAREIPWAVTWGNHDEESTETSDTGMYRPELLEQVRKYPHNVNPAAIEDVPGYSNGYLPIEHNGETIFAAWLLDSGAYAPPRLYGQSLRNRPAYDYLKHAQINWYRETSMAAEAQHGRKIPSLMFFHIPTYEHLDMWNGGPSLDSEMDHLIAAGTFNITGDKYEGVSVGLFNSGIYAACQERGDVRGIYCGHDHLNSYAGNYYGIELGYAPATGFGPYGAPGEQKNLLRGARVFDLNANDSRIYTGTRLLLAREMGIDVSPAPQALDQPLPLPDFA